MEENKIINLKISCKVYHQNNIYNIHNLELNTTGSTVYKLNNDYVVIFYFESGKIKKEIKPTYKIYYSPSVSSYNTPLKNLLLNTNRCVLEKDIKKCDLILLYYKYFSKNKNFIEKKYSNYIDSQKQFCNKKNLAKLISGSFYDIPTYDVHEGELPSSFKNTDKNKMYILKPESDSCGYGIKIKSLNDMIKYVKQQKLSNHIVQEYIEPKLIFGYKFDLRIYVFMTDKGKFFVSKHGMIRLAYNKYESGTTSLKTHLTNTSLDKKNSKIKSFSKWSEQSKYFSKIENVVGDLVKRVSFKSKYKGVHIFGFDIMIDKNDNLRLIEVNKCPSYSSINSIAKNIKTNMIMDYLNFCDEINIKNA